MNILSQETIKPSSPTPPQLKTHVLPLVDNYYDHVLMPIFFFYKSYNDGGIISNLKKSLSLCLTQYYPFAGRLLTPNDGHIDCNDEGVEFFEASHEGTLEDFIIRNENDESLHQLLPNFDKYSPNLMHVQLNYLSGGGVALAVAISHKVADMFTDVTFYNQWAKVARGESPVKPIFLTSSTSHNNVFKLPEAKSTNDEDVNYVTKSFVFPNSKLVDLKKKVMSSMGMDVTNPNLTRVEVLTSLLFKCAVDATTTASGFFKPSVILHPVNMRNKIFKKDHEKVVGNILSDVIVRTNDLSEIVLHEIVAKLRKGKMEIKETNIQEIGEKYATIWPTLAVDSIYSISSFCWFPFYEVDFGWGKPVKVKYAFSNLPLKNFTLLDTPERDGIEATVRLPLQEMMIFQQDKELLAYVGA